MLGFLQIDGVRPSFWLTLPVLKISPSWNYPNLLTWSGWLECCCRYVWMTILWTSAIVLLVMWGPVLLSPRRHEKLTRRRSRAG